MLGVGESSATRVLLATGTTETSDEDELQAERMVKWTSRMIDTCEQVQILRGIFSVQRRTPRESDTASPTRGGVLVEPV